MRVLFAMFEQNDENGLPPTDANFFGKKKDGPRALVYMIVARWWIEGLFSFRLVKVDVQPSQSL